MLNLGLTCFSVHLEANNTDMLNAGETFLTLKLVFIIPSLERHTGSNALALTGLFEIYEVF